MKRQNLNLDHSRWCEKPWVLERFRDVVLVSSMGETMALQSQDCSGCSDPMTHLSLDLARVKAKGYSQARSID